MLRSVIWFAVAAAACTPAHAPRARGIGKVLAIGGVVGLTGSALASQVADTRELVVGFSFISGLGIVTFAVGELSDPPKGPRPEPEVQKLRRWARILTERAGGDAREGRCPRVRRLERRVHLYDREVHDFVFMRDPEIRRCLDGQPTASVPAAGQPTAALPAESSDVVPAGAVPAGATPPLALPPLEIGRPSP